MRWVICYAGLPESEKIFLPALDTVDMFYI